MAVKRAEREGVLHPLSFRVTPELKAKLDASASANGRSVTAEIQSRLEASFRQDEILEGIISRNLAARPAPSAPVTEPEHEPAVDLDALAERAADRAIERMLRRMAPPDTDLALEEELYRRHVYDLRQWAARAGDEFPPEAIPSFEDWLAARKEQFRAKQREAALEKLESRGKKRPAA